MTQSNNVGAPQRRSLLKAGVGLAGIAALPGVAQAQTASVALNPSTKEGPFLDTITTRDGTRIFFKDWGPRDAQPIVFHHGWPLSGDEWDNQMLYFYARGYRVIAHDRRGHGRSSQAYNGNDMDTYAADLIELARALDLKNAIHVGHSTGGGEAAHYVARAEPGRVAKLVLVGAVTPVMVKLATNPEGLPLEVFDGFRAAHAKNRAQFFLELASGPFYGFNRKGSEISMGLIQNWFRQAMMGGTKAQYDCIKAFSETDFTEDLKRIDQPVLIMHGEDDQVVPVHDSAHKAIRLVRNGRLKLYKGLPHGMAATHAEIINEDLLGFFKA
ncbi:alpha/beta hydrolase [Ferrovibrio terrae]|uniref:Alpha/beta hydrolase n=1 Tax=Ferrovibrio terrae TaxID=2594003 RepID=A0A516GZY5_9PROT|nr:alpha/beta hydrolase [Ferrovibrio terrae]